MILNAYSTNFQTFKKLIAELSTLKRQNVRRFVIVFVDANQRKLFSPRLLNSIFGIGRYDLHLRDG